MFQKKYISLDFAKLLRADYQQQSGSCIRHQVDELQDIHEKYGGFPPTYVMQNTTIHQLWWTPEEIDFQDLGQQLGMEVITVSSIMQPPGNVIPWHRDTFFQIKTRFPQDQRTRVRANIHLEDCKMGHVLQYELDGAIHTHVNWQAGDVLLWDESVEHVGANVGFENKYTLQVSGFLLDN
jgi:hypothetical protein